MLREDELKPLEKDTEEPVLALPKVLLEEADTVGIALPVALEVAELLLRGFAEEGGAGMKLPLLLRVAEPLVVVEPMEEETVGALGFTLSLVLLRLLELSKEEGTGTVPLGLVELLREEEKTGTELSLRAVLCSFEEGIGATLEPVFELPIEEDGIGARSLPDVLELPIEDEEGKLLDPMEDEETVALLVVAELPTEEEGAALLRTVVELPTEEEDVALLLEAAVLPTEEDEWMLLLTVAELPTEEEVALLPTEEEAALLLTIDAGGLGAELSIVVELDMLSTGK